ncbi:MAG: hypothetical protein LH467_06540 [Gemmatimonadaceae bacterium]|nr:hypothetical protein [Gemmatimonadaceae bacterium]
MRVRIATSGGEFHEDTLRADTLRLTPGDTVFLLYETTEGWNWWYHGNTYDGDQFWEGPDSLASRASSAGRSASAATMWLSRPKTDDWWYITLRSGRSGWWRHDSAQSFLSTTALAKWWNDRCPDTR